MKNCIVASIFLSLLFANSNGPNSGYAHNAPNFNNCTSCHSGTANTGDGSVTFTGLPEQYIPGETYEIGVSVDGTGGSGYGFQAIAQSGNSAVGTLALNDNSSQVELNGDYIQHSAATISGNWVFNWIAPSTDVGEVVFSASGLAANYPSSNSGDYVYTVSATIGPQVPLEEDLFISEYAEGSASNKYIEIFNGTGSEVNLSSYSVQGTNNGTSWGDNGERDVQLSGVLASGDVYVLAANEADQIILDQTDLALAYESPMHHNGDDGIALLKDGVIIDAVGVENDDPGTAWDVAGVTNATQNHTLVRKSSVTEGNGGQWENSAGTTEENSEWIVYDVDTWDYLGSHPHDISDPGPTIVVNEFLASSEECCGVDILGSAEDFVELYNFGQSDVDISGWGFSDTDGEVATVAPEGTTIGAGEFFVLWYSGEEDLFPQIDDKLSADGESIYIADAEGNPVVLLDFTAQEDDISYGRVPDGGDTWQSLTNPSPGSSNVETATYTSIYDIQYVSDPDVDDASPLEGQEVTINGVVTAEFWGSDDRKFMHVQDANGPWNGIVCYEAAGWDQFPWVDESGSSVEGPGEGHLVSLTGIVNEYYNLTQLLDITSGVVHSATDLEIVPEIVLVGDLGESYEGCLVQINNAIVSNPDIGYGEWEFSTVDINGGGLGICDDKWDYFYYPSQDHGLASIVGVLDYSFSEYKLQPRLARDIVESGIARIQRIQQVLHSDLMKAGEDEISDKSYLLGDTVTVRGIVTMPTGLSYAGSGVKFIFSDVNGGPWSSILSYDPDSSAFPSLYEGDLIEATGFIEEYTTGPANMTELFITEPINIIDFEQPLPAVNLVNTGDLRWPTEAEQWGNVKVRVDDAVVTGNDFQYEVFEVDDGTGSVLVDDDSDSLSSFFATVGPPPVGSLLQSIEGWLYHHYGSNADSTAYKLCPLYASDIEFGAGPPSIIAVNREPCAPMLNDDEVLVSCTIIDNSSISEALVHYKIDGSEEVQTVAMTTVDDSIFTAIIPITGAGFVSYQISATDDGTDQSEPKTSVFPYEEELGFYLTDDLGIEHVQYTPYPSGNSYYNGCVVTLTGIVTGDTAQYNSSYSSYAFQNESSQWNGLIFDTEDLVTLTRGQQVTVTGLITDNDPDYDYKFSGNTRLINAEVSVGELSIEPDFLNVSCEDISTESEEVESYEGVLVKLNNVTVSSINDYDWTITDESGFVTLIDDDMSNMETDNFLSTLVEGQELESVSGIFNYSFGSYKVQIRDLNDLGQSLGINDDIEISPYSYSLMDNYPNPFNPKTQIRFSIGKRENVKLIVYDMMGRQVNTLIDGESFNSGFHVVNWRGIDDKGNKVPSGVYVYRIKAGDYIADKKMLLLK